MIIKGNETNQSAKLSVDKNKDKEIEIRQIPHAPKSNNLNLVQDSQETGFKSELQIKILNKKSKLFKEKREFDLIKKEDNQFFLKNQNDQSAILIDDFKKKLNNPLHLKSFRISTLSLIDNDNQRKEDMSSTMEFLNGKIHSKLNYCQKLIKKPNLKKLPQLKRLSLGNIIQD